MSLQVNRKYYWMVEFISRCAPTLAELQDAWMSSGLSDGEGLSRRTFFNMKRDIANYLGIEIYTRKLAGAYRYYIEGGFDDHGVQSWLINTMSVRNTLEQNISIKDRILLESVPSSDNNLNLVLAAIRDNLCISFVYEDFWEAPVRVTLKPYFVRLFNQRWYVAGPRAGEDGIRTYGLDHERFKDFQLTSEHFTYPGDFDPEQFSMSFYGAHSEPLEENPVQTVRLLVWQKQDFYLESLPLHPSQVTLYRSETDGYSIFQYRLQPTYAFEMALRSFGSDVEVLSPKSLRDRMSSGAEDVLREYRGESRATCKEHVPYADSL